jgi:hypothetical protein
VLIQRARKEAAICHITQTHSGIELPQCFGQLVNDIRGKCISAIIRDARRGKVRNKSLLWNEFETEKMIHSRVSATQHQSRLIKPSSESQKNGFAVKAEELLCLRHEFENLTYDPSIDLFHKCSSGARAMWNQSVAKNKKRVERANLVSSNLLFGLRLRKKMSETKDLAAARHLDVS